MRVSQKVGTVLGVRRVALRGRVCERMSKLQYQVTRRKMLMSHHLALKIISCQRMGKVEAAGIEPAARRRKSFLRNVLSILHRRQQRYGRNQGSNYQCLTITDSDASTDFEPSIDYIRRAWPHLPPHIRGAVVMLVDTCPSSIGSGAVMSHANTSPRPLQMKSRSNSSQFRPEGGDQLASNRGGLPGNHRPDYSH